MKESLVSFYGEKPKVFEDWLKVLREQFQGSLVGGYSPYEDPQIHATLFGLEDIGSPWNGEGIGDVLSRFLPQIVRFGGFSPHDSPFLSRAQRPFERSFQVRKDAVVMIGWPIDQTEVDQIKFPRSVERLRGELERILVTPPKYQDDNDFYMVLGRFEPSPSPITASERTKMQEAEQGARLWMSENPLELSWSRENVQVVSYRETSLPLSTTRVMELKQWGG